MKEIEVKSAPSTFKKGGKQCHQLFPKITKPMNADEFIEHELASASCNQMAVLVHRPTCRAQL